MCAIHFVIQFEQFEQSLTLKSPCKDDHPCCIHLQDLKTPQTQHVAHNPDPLYRRQTVRAVKDLMILPERGLCRSGEAVRRTWSLRIRRTTSFWSLWGTNFGFLKLLRLSIETMRIMQQLQKLMVVIIWHFGFSILILRRLLRLHFAFAAKLKFIRGGR